jgi:hypothetical protein
MTTNTTIPTDSEIRAAAIGKGFADAQFIPQFIQDRPTVMDAGEWHLLFVRFRNDADWVLFGRRRTRSELLILAQRDPLDFR